MADVVDCLVLTSLRTDDVAAVAAIWLVLSRRYDEPLFGAALKSKVRPGRTAPRKLFSRSTEAFDYCRKIAVTLIDADRPVLNECFYEKVIKVKADVAALLNLFSDVSIDVRW